MPLSSWPASADERSWQALLASPLAHAVAAAGVGLWEIDIASGREWWSDVTLAMYGLPPGSEAPSRQEWRSRFVHPDDLPRCLVRAAEFERSGRPYEMEYRIRPADGSPARWLFSRSAFKFGDPGRVLGLTLDITERREAEAQYRDARLLLEHAARQVGFGFGLREPGGEVGEWSDELKRLWGLPPEAPTPPRSQLLDLIEEQDRELAARELATPIAPGELSEFSFTVKRGQDGRPRTLTTRAFSEYDEQGRKGRTFFAVVDNTELLARERQVAELLEQLQMAAEAGGIGTWDRDPLSGENRWNTECARILGLPEDAAPLSREAYADMVHPEDRARVARQWDEADRGVTPLDFEYRIVRSDGQVRWVRSRGRIDRDGSGRVVRRRGVIFDITERRQAEAERHARELAERASAAKTEFLSRMSHELRTPLNAVLGFSQLMALDATEPLSPVQRQRLDHVQRAGWHLLALVNDVLDLSRLEARVVPLAQERVELDAAIAACLAMVAPLATQHSVALHWQPTPAAPTAVWADTARLRQLLVSLLSNGIKYNRAGGWVRVEVRAGAAPATVVLAVCDNGLGLAPERLPQLFEPFNRAGREASGIEGTGLGLALVKLLVAQMGGTVEVDSTAGAGSEFRLLLPAPPGSEAAGAGDQTDQASVSDPR